MPGLGICENPSESFGMPAWDIFSHTAMLAAFVNAKCFDNAKVLFDDMPEWDVVCCNTLMAANESYDQAKDLFDSLREWALVSYNTILKTLSRTSKACDAKSFFDSMLARDMFSWNVLLKTYTQIGYLGHAKSLFSGMKMHDTVACNTMLLLYEMHGAVEESTVLVSSMPYWDSVTWNNMLLAYTRNGHLEDAIRVYEILPSDFVSCTVMLSAYSQSGNLDKAVSLFHRFSYKDQALWNALLAAYVGNGCLEYAQAVFLRAPKLSSVSWNIMVAGNAKVGFIGEVLRLVHTMVVEGVEPEIATLLSILVGCNHGGDVYTAWKYLQCMVCDFGIAPTREVYCCVLDLLMRANYIEAARDLFYNMPFEPEAVDWKCMNRLFQAMRLV
ncbi:pentatricopeptide repeat-containing protein At4g02750-like [Selaginella moellendorffii]|uniref:pentatricopeptide repeat-containing protein At4g02750-like n=1 Tax=Selaginella moellendorffii TaxID=88036 RepID=UPI000D1CD408|nr:pentatricopeptide repeat-containing protein At4g02750-like [Selaginella moellendorffii]|eukprot:XP_024528473.1 pentatricopeptide repeat-containing protein At4g02750-like [Selaginella moellendorffii]